MSLALKHLQRSVGPVLIGQKTNTILLLLLVLLLLLILATTLYQVPLLRPGTVLKKNFVESTKFFCTRSTGIWDFVEPNEFPHGILVRTVLIKYQKWKLVSIHDIPCCGGWCVVLGVVAGVLVEVVVEMSGGWCGNWCLVCSAWCGAWCGDWFMKETSWVVTLPWINCLWS
jgi:hypothetical protein